MPHTFTSPRTSSPIEYRTVTPDGWTSEEPLPLLLALHGASSSSAIIEAQAHLFYKAWANGILPRCIVACASTPTVGGFYMNEWESIVAEDFPTHMRDKHNADLSRTMLLGASMGGYGALKLAFKNPGKYKAVAALAPTIFPAENPDEIRPRNRIGNLQLFLDAMKQSGYGQNHIPARARANAEAIKNLPIWFDCGDEDFFNLQDGAEYLHRTLWDLDVSHDYHLVKGADHVGPPIQDRYNSALAFLGNALYPEAETVIPSEITSWIENGRQGPPPVIDFSAAYSPILMRQMTKSQVEDAQAQDPTTRDRFGKL